MRVLTKPFVMAGPASRRAGKPPFIRDLETSANADCLPRKHVRRLSVHSNLIIRFVVAICMLAGLVIGPAAFAAPSHAMTVSTAATTMPAGMDCCPEKPVKSGCAKCPLMALCSTPIAEHIVDIRLPQVVARTVRPTALVDEAALAGRSAQPLPELSSKLGLTGP